MTGDKMPPGHSGLSRHQLQKLCNIKTKFIYAFTYDHRTLKTRLPVRSALFKQRTGGLVVRWVTTSEYPLLYVFFASSYLSLSVLLVHILTFDARATQLAITTLRSYTGSSTSDAGVEGSVAGVLIPLATLSAPVVHLARLPAAELVLESA
jgi:hypothetical protein